MDSDNNAAKVQHVNKKSSDELLQKFAEMKDEKAGKKLGPKRRRRSRGSGGEWGCESLSNGQGSGPGERRSLLAPAASRKSALMRQLRIRGRAQLRAKEIRHKSLFGTIEKTWRRTIEGASKVFMEKHYNRHKRLINDIVY